MSAGAAVHRSSGAVPMGLGRPPRVVVEAAGRRQAGAPVVLGPRSRLTWRLATVPVLGERLWAPVSPQVARAFATGRRLLAASACWGTVSSWDAEPALVVQPVEPTGLVAKVGITSAAARRVDQELDALRTLERSWDGAPAASPFPRTGRAVAGGGCVERLDPVGATTGRLPAVALEALGRLARSVGAPAAATDCDACLRLFSELGCDTLWHGDATPWNMLRRGDTLCLIDWELAMPFVSVPAALVRAQWEVRSALAGLRVRNNLRVRDPYQVAATCFDNARKERLGKDDLWRDRVVPHPQPGVGHRHVRA